MVCHSSRLEIRSVSGTFHCLSQTVFVFGSASEKRISTLAAFGNENLDLRLGSGACDGSGHHFERFDTFSLMLE